MSADIYIDCYGKYHGNQSVQLSSGAQAHFLFGDAEGQKGGYAMALFLNQAALSNDIYRYPKERRICFLSESPIHPVYRHVEHLRKQFCYVFTHNRELLDLGEPFVKHYIGTSWIEGTTGELPSKSKLVSFVGSIEHGGGHGYGLRKDVAELCLHLGHVDCYGKGIRPIKGKLEGLAEYTFSIAMENVREDYYFSEKLVDCLLADCVPIYWGCPGIGDIFDARGMILFESFDQLEVILGELSIQRYEQMIPYAMKNKQAVIENKWHSLNGCYSRLAYALDEITFLSSRPAMQPSSLVKRMVRKAMQI